uniref:Uncharacterized protein n=1 Tax=Arundo donax TaxID=35708 RepID=A0A0A9FVD2_ARUDO
MVRYINGFPHQFEKFKHSTIRHNNRKVTLKGLTYGHGKVEPFFVLTEFPPCLN